MHMKTPIILAGLLLGSLAVAGCTPQSNGQEARELKDTLEGLPAVVNVRLYYDQPEMLDSAKVDLDVTMDVDATPEQVSAVVEAAYDGLTDVHAEEEGNLIVGFGDDKLYLRTFESEADTDDVADAALAGAVVAAERRRADISLMTQSVEDAPHVDSVVRLRMRHGTTSSEVDQVTESIEETFGDLPVEVDIRIARH
jgi:hypothetical protein